MKLKANIESQFSIIKNTRTNILRLWYYSFEYLAPFLPLSVDLGNTSSKLPTDNIGKVEREEEVKLQRGCPANHV